ncbi:MAG: tetratricopeptide repeat protein, partial [Desulfobacterales bacterium]
VAVFSTWTYARNSVWQDEIALLQDCVQKSPQKARPRNALGSALLKRGRKNEAVYQFNEALRIQPDYAQAHNNLGVALAEDGQLAEAIFHFREALSEVPGYVDARNNLKKATGDLGLDRKIAATLEALVRNPEALELYYELGDLYKRRGRSTDAIRCYEIILARDPQNCRTLNELAMMHTAKGNYDAAISLYQKVIAIQPHKPDTYLNIARIYAKQNKREGSIEWLKLAATKSDTKESHARIDKIIKKMESFPKQAR